MVNFALYHVMKINKPIKLSWKVTDGKFPEGYGISKIVICIFILYQSSDYIYILKPIYNMAAVTQILCILYNIMTRSLLCV